MRLMGADCMYKEDNRSLRRTMPPLGNVNTNGKDVDLLWSF